MTVLVADDEETLVMGLSRSLVQEGFAVLAASNGAECLRQVSAHRVDLVILDVMMPELDGMAVCRKLRERSDIPIIMLTARDDVVDRVLGLEYGADDYLTKPFHTRELIARVRAVLRRTGRIERDDETLTAGDLLLHRGRRSVSRSGSPVELTAREFDILSVLMANPGIVFTREQLFEQVWEEQFGDTRAIDVHVRRIREKIEIDPRHPRLLLTRRGVGYCICDDPGDA